MLIDGNKTSSGHHQVFVSETEILVTNYKSNTNSKC